MAGGSLDEFRRMLAAAEASLNLKRSRLEASAAAGIQDQQYAAVGDNRR